jgi:pimeloyl-ACP methyl ester carboxylesterase
VTIIPAAGHSPHREAPGATLNAISEFASRILFTDEGSQGRAA